MSKGALVALEGARGNPNLTTLVRVADALGRSVTSLMEHAREEPVVVVDAGAVAPLWTGPAGGTARLLLTNPRPLPVELWRWRLHPGERHDSRPHQPGVTETLSVVQGRMVLTLGGAEHALRAGETTAFAADVPHAYEGAGRGPCELIMSVHLRMEHRCSEAQLAAAEAHLRDSGLQKATDHPHIAAWRAAFSAFGSKPSRYPSSAEALMTRVLKGQELPRVNALVDLYNAVSVRHVVPLGGEDADHLEGALRLTVTEGGEPSDPRDDGSDVEPVPPGEVVWRDDRGVTCRRWNWRQGRRTQLTGATTRAFFVFDRLDGLAVAICTAPPTSSRPCSPSGGRTAASSGWSAR